MIYQDVARCTEGRFIRIPVPVRGKRHYLVRDILAETLPVCLSSVALPEKGRHTQDAKVFASFNLGLTKAVRFTIVYFDEIK